MYTINYLLSHSNLPGPRGNLELLYSFSKEADKDVVRECLNYIKNDTANSPQEFVGMCGIVGYAVLNKSDIDGTMDFLRKYASHTSWRIREAVAMAVQELALNDIRAVIKNFQSWIDGNCLEQRAVVASLCEPKLLSDRQTNLTILMILKKITNGFNELDKLSDSQKVLKKSLGYGWSVVIAAQPKEGKIMFELFKNNINRHVKWIMKENLKKNRLVKMDKEWVENMSAAFI